MWITRANFERQQRILSLLYLYNVEEENEKNMYVILLTNATRFAAMKNDFKHYDYGITMKMREDVHNAIYKDLTEEEVLK